MLKQINRLLLVLLTVVFASCGDKKDGNIETVRDSLAMSYTVINTLPHNVEAFTEGLVVYNNKILESTGQNNMSWIAEVNPGSGEHTKKVNLTAAYFGEGITVMNNKIYQLTYKTNVGFIYDAKTYKKLGEFPFVTDTKEGWGITHDNVNLIMGDGSEKLYFLDTTSLKVVRKILVTDGGTRVKKINELEYINGYVYANVWETNWILKIDPTSGKVVGRADLSAIGNQIKAMNPSADVMNGIAYDKNSKAFLITGKYWPKAFLIRMK